MVKVLTLSSKVFPEGLISETLRTLALLLPTHDSATRKWFLPHLTKFRLDPAALTCGQLKLEDRQIDHFKFWHDRLVVLKSISTIRSRGRSSNGGLMTESVCNGFGWLYYWLFARCSSELYGVLRGDGRFIRLIIPVRKPRTITDYSLVRLILAGFSLWGAFLGYPSI